MIAGQLARLHARKLFRYNQHGPISVSVELSVSCDPGATVTRADVTATRRDLRAFFRGAEAAQPDAAAILARLLLLSVP